MTAVVLHLPNNSNSLSDHFRQSTQILQFLNLSAPYHLVMQTCVRCTRTVPLRRSYATVGPMTYLGKPPKQPVPPPPKPPSPPTSQTLDSVRWVPDTSPLHNTILSKLNSQSTSLHKLTDQYVEHSGTVLDVSLPYESRPNSQRKTKFEYSDNPSVVMIAHAVQHKTLHKVAFCSGFAIDVSQLEHPSGDNLIVTCAHTMEDVRIMLFNGRAAHSS